MAKDPQRREMILHALQESRLEALASSPPTEVLLLTGYWPVMGASLAVCTREGDVCGIVPKDELELAEATSDAEFFAYEPQTLRRLITLTEALVDPVVELAAWLHLKPGDIGVNLGAGAQGNSYPSVNYFRASIVAMLHKLDRKMSAVSADATLIRLMAVKTTTDLNLLRRVCQRAAIGFHAARNAIVAGRREDEIAAEIEGAFARGANDGFERSKGYFFCMAGPNSYKASGAYARTRSHIVQDGDLVMIHANTVGDGYWSDITRTWVVWPPNDQQQHMYDAVGEARQAALKAIAPGASAKMVDSAARSVLTRHGFGTAFKHATGHGVGFTWADGNALPRVHPKSTDILEAGMTFNIEPPSISTVSAACAIAMSLRVRTMAEVLTDF